MLTGPLRPPRSPAPAWRPSRRRPRITADAQREAEELDQAALDAVLREVTETGEILAGRKPAAGV